MPQKKLPEFPKPTKKQAGIAAAIAAAFVIAAPFTMKYEGKENVAYWDRLPAKPVATVCYGHTGPEVVPGRRYSDAQCKDLLESDFAKHAEGVARCTPGIVQNPHIFAAASDFAFNAGVGRYCSSSMARLFNAGKLAEGCRYFNRYVYAGGKVYRGLVRRRADLSAVCLKGV